MVVLGVVGSGPILDLFWLAGWLLDWTGAMRRDVKDVDKSGRQCEEQAWGGEREQYHWGHLKRELPIRQTSGDAG